MSKHTHTVGEHTAFTTNIKQYKCIGCVLCIGWMYFTCWCDFFFFFFVCCPPGFGLRGTHTSWTPFLSIWWMTSEWPSWTPTNIMHLKKKKAHIQTCLLVWVRRLTWDGMMFFSRTQSFKKVRKCHFINYWSLVILFDTCTCSLWSHKLATFIPMQYNVKLNNLTVENELSSFSRQRNTFALLTVRK